MFFGGGLNRNTIVCQLCSMPLRQKRAVYDDGDDLNDFYHDSKSILVNNLNSNIRHLSKNVKF